MEKSKTARGFSIVNFTDLYGAECSLQKSSLGSEDAIWLGCDFANPKRLVFNKGWQPYPFPEDVSFSTRMHLSQEQVRELLPILQKFVETGEIY